MPEATWRIKQRPSFTCFPELPPEIRTVIWRLAEPDRLLTVRHVRSKERSPFDIHDTFSIYQPRLFLSQVNREARRETGIDYIHIQPGDYDGSLRNGIQFNPRRDTIAFNTKSFSAKCWSLFLQVFSDREDLAIERLAFAVSSFRAYETWFSTLSLMPFPHLKELCLVTGRDSVTSGLVSEIDPSVYSFNRQALDLATRLLISNRTALLNIPVVKWMEVYDKDGMYFR
jgi:hypothetical protein